MAALFRIILACSLALVALAPAAACAQAVVPMAPLGGSALSAQGLTAPALAPDGTTNPGNPACTPATNCNAQGLPLDGQCAVIGGLSYCNNMNGINGYSECMPNNSGTCTYDGVSEQTILSAVGNPSGDGSGGNSNDPGDPMGSLLANIQQSLTTPCTVQNYTPGAKNAPSTIGANFDNLTSGFSSLSVSIGKTELPVGETLFGTLGLISLMLFVQKMVKGMPTFRDMLDQTVTKLLFLGVMYALLELAGGQWGTPMIPAMEGAGGTLAQGFISNILPKGANGAATVVPASTGQEIDFGLCMGGKAFASPIVVVIDYIYKSMKTDWYNILSSLPVIGFLLIMALSIGLLSGIIMLLAFALLGIHIFALDVTAKLIAVGGVFMLGLLALKETEGFAKPYFSLGINVMVTKFVLVYEAGIITWFMVGVMFGDGSTGGTGGHPGVFQQLLNSVQSCTDAAKCTTQGYGNDLWLFGSFLELLIASIFGFSLALAGPKLASTLTSGALAYTGADLAGAGLATAGAAALVGKSLGMLAQMASKIMTAQASKRANKVAAPRGETDASSKENSDAETSESEREATRESMSRSEDTIANAKESQSERKSFEELRRENAQTQDQRRIHSENVDAQSNTNDTVNPDAVAHADRHETTDHTADVTTKTADEQELDASKLEAAQLLGELGGTGAAAAAAKTAASEEAQRAKEPITASTRARQAQASASALRGLAKKTKTAEGKKALNEAASHLEKAAALDRAGDLQGAAAEYSRACAAAAGLGVALAGENTLLRTRAGTHADGIATIANSARASTPRTAEEEAAAQRAREEAVLATDTALADAASADPKAAAAFAQAGTHLKNGLAADRAGDTHGAQIGYTAAASTLEGIAANPAFGEATRKAARQGAGALGAKDSGIIASARQQGTATRASQQRRDALDRTSDVLGSLIGSASPNAGHLSKVRSALSDAKAADASGNLDTSAAHVESAIAQMDGLLAGSALSTQERAGISSARTSLGAHLASVRSSATAASSRLAVVNSTVGRETRAFQLADSIDATAASISNPQTQELLARASESVRIASSLDVAGNFSASESAYIGAAASLAQVLADPSLDGRSRATIGSAMRQLDGRDGHIAMLATLQAPVAGGTQRQEAIGQVTQRLGAAAADLAPGPQQSALLQAQEHLNAGAAFERQGAYDQSVGAYAAAGDTLRAALPSLPAPVAAAVRAQLDQISGPTGFANTARIVDEQRRAGSTNGTSIPTIAARTAAAQPVGAAVERLAQNVNDPQHKATLTRAATEIGSAAAADRRGDSRGALAGYTNAAALLSQVGTSLPLPMRTALSAPLRALTGPGGLVSTASTAHQRAQAANLQGKKAQAAAQSLTKQAAIHERTGNASGARAMTAVASAMNAFGRNRTLLNAPAGRTALGTVSNAALAASQGNITQAQRYLTTASHQLTDLASGDFRAAAAQTQLALGRSAQDLAGLASANPVGPVLSALPGAASATQALAQPLGPQSSKALAGALRQLLKEVSEQKPASPGIARLLGGVAQSLSGMLSSALSLSSMPAGAWTTDSPHYAQAAQAYSGAMHGLFSGTASPAMTAALLTQAGAGFDLAAMGSTDAAVAGRALKVSGACYEAAGALGALAPAVSEAPPPAPTVAPLIATTLPAPPPPSLEERLKAVSVNDPDMAETLKNLGKGLAANRTSSGDDRRYGALHQHLRSALLDSLRQTGGSSSGGVHWERPRPS